MENMPLVEVRRVVVNAKGDLGLFLHGMGKKTEALDAAIKALHEITSRSHTPNSREDRIAFIAESIQTDLHTLSEERRISGTAMDEKARAERLYGGLQALLTLIEYER